MAKRKRPARDNVTDKKIAAAVILAKKGMGDLNDLIDALAAEYVRAQAEFATKAAEAVNSGMLGEFRYRQTRIIEAARILRRVNTVTPLRSRRLVKQSVRLGTRTARKAGITYEADSSFSRVEKTAIDTLTDNLVNRLDDAVNTVGRRVEDIYRREGLRLAALQLSKERPLDDATETLVDRLRKQGITSFIDKGGREWKLDSYAEMVIRTVSSEAIFTGSQTAIIGRNFDLVQVNKVRDPCDKCAQYDGNTYSLSGRATNYPKLKIVFPIHPRCRHFITLSTEAMQERREFLARAAA